jgi:hypothetical protein
MKEYYVDISLQDILKTGHTEKSRRDDATEKLTEILAYLKLSKRYKMDRRYINSSFGEFLLHEYQIDEKKQFDVWSTAYMHFPEESKEIGPTLVADIKKKCGVDKVAPIVDEIKTKQETTGQRLPLTSNGNHPSIEKIITPHKRPAPEKPKSTLREDLKFTTKKLDDTTQDLKATREELIEKEEQVNKLKKTVIKSVIVEAPNPITMDITEEEVNPKEKLLEYFEKKIGKVFTEIDYEILEEFVDRIKILETC